MIQYLRYLNRLRIGHKPIFVEYEYDLKPRWGSEGNQYIKDILEIHNGTIEKNINKMIEYKPLIDRIVNDLSLVPQVNWKNHFIPALDGLSLIWAAAHSKSTFVEIGSGNSTIFARRSLDYYGLNTRLVSIDPYPRVEINTLCDEIIRLPLEKVDLSIFEDLQQGDVVFVDNSHRSFMNSDVTVVMLDVLPRLKPGVLIGFHDIFLPFDYFESWSGRAYNEQYLLASYLLSNPKYFDIQLSNYWSWSKGAHVKPLAGIWELLGNDVRDRSASAFWAMKN